MDLILVVDDDTAFRATLAETLEDLGYRVRQAASVCLLYTSPSPRD